MTLMRQKFNKRPDWKNYVSTDMIELRKKILKHSLETGNLSPEDSEFLVRFDKLTRVCDCCGKKVGTKLWRNRLFKTKSGEERPIGLASVCFDCELKNIVH